MPTEIQYHCPLSYCDPHECGWRTGKDTCEWTDQAITTTGTDGTGDEDDET